MNSAFESMRLPKNFQPVGVSNSAKFFAWAPLSTAPDVGIERATALMPPWAAKKGMQSACAARIAKESLGVTKNCVPASRSACRRVDGVGAGPCVDGVEAT